MKTLVLLLALYFPATALANPNAVCAVRLGSTLTEPGGTGTGFFIAKNTIITAYHVVAKHITEGRAIRIEYKDKLYTARCTKHARHSDLALLTAEVNNTISLAVAGKHPSLEGAVEAFGFPNGVWAVHSSKGILRQVQNAKTKGETKSYEMYQSYITVIPGMSGGPLIYKGQVVGVVSGMGTKGDSHHGYFSAYTAINDLLTQ